MEVDATADNEEESQDCSNESNDQEVTRPKRMKVEPQNVKEKPCVICNKMKMKGDVQWHRVCEAKRAKKLLSAMRFFKDEVSDRCILLETSGDVFAADIMYHPNCLRNYLLRFKREVEFIVNDDDDFAKNKNIDQTFQDILKSLDLQHQAIHVSTVRDLFNEKYHEGNIGRLTYS